ncbi:MAG: DUF3179 domain-containing (seleno)protein [Phycisphaerae bacterium]|nr:DUF3179 domain-containing (seleno)protein [Phycisphaerae bacterium]
MTKRPSTKLTFRDGGWVLVLAALLSLSVAVWGLSSAVLGKRPIGGHDLASYQFDLTNSLVPEAELIPSGQPRDFLRALTVREVMPASAMADFNQGTRKRYLLTQDRVVGVVIDGAARAYALSVLNGHEIIEDTLNGVPIAVTYSPFCDAAVVYDRRVNGTTLSFGVSGLLRNANTLLYDRGSAQPSLWQQLDGRAITGPHAGTAAQLTPIAGTCITTWADWIAAHPDSDVPRRDEGNVQLYRRISYERSHVDPTIEFPVTPSPSAVLQLKAPVVVVDANGERGAYAIERLRAAASNGQVIATLGGVVLQFDIPAEPMAVARVSAPNGEPIVVRPCFWFAANTLLGVREALP